MPSLKTIFTSLFSVIFLSASGVLADIKTAQTYLKQMGYNAGTIDGLWGKKTEEALELFLRDQNQKWDGTFDQKEFQMIEKAILQTKPSKQVTTAITLHDVGGWHEPIWRAGLYEPTIKRISKVVNANTLSVVDTHFITKHAEGAYEIKYSPDNRDWTPTNDQWQSIGEVADANNLNVQMLIMIYNVVGINQYKIEDDADRTNNKKFWDSYFSQYSELVSRRAIAAEKAGVDSIILGYNSTASLAQNPKYWLNLIQAIRSAGFSGELGLYTELKELQVQNHFSGITDAIYRNNKTDVKKIIREFDCIVFSVQNTDKHKLSKALRSYKEYGKKIQIMVITPSVEDGNSSGEYIEPAMGHNNETNSLAPFRNLSFETQIESYKSVIDIVNDQNFNFVTGINSWGYHFRDDLFHALVKGDSDYQKSANVRGKPAEDLLSQWYEHWR